MISMPDPVTLWDYLNSEFVKSATGALAGAWAGAQAAQAMAERSKVRDEIFKEMRATSAAATICFSITNAFIAAKGQQVKPLYDRFQKGRAAFIEHVRKEQQIPPHLKTVFEVHFDLKTFVFPRLPVEQLRNIILERMSAPTRAIMLASIVEQTAHDLNLFAHQRNELVEEFRASGKLDPATYYGLETDRGADQRYSSFLQGISEHTDNCIWFSKTLGEDLSAHGKRLKERLPKRFRESAPKIVTAKFEKGAGMIPPDEPYKDWQTMFHETVPKRPFWKSWLFD